MSDPEARLVRATRATAIALRILLDIYRVIGSRIIGLR